MNGRAERIVQGAIAASDAPNGGGRFDWVGIGRLAGWVLFAGAFLTMAVAMTFGVARLETRLADARATTARQSATIASLETQLDEQSRQLEQLRQVADRQTRTIEALRMQVRDLGAEPVQPTSTTQDREGGGSRQPQAADRGNRPAGGGDGAGSTSPPQPAPTRTVTATPTATPTSTQPDDVCLLDVVCVDVPLDSPQTEGILR